MNHFETSFKLRKKNFVDIYSSVQSEVKTDSPLIGRSSKKVQGKAENKFRGKAEKMFKDKK